MKLSVQEMERLKTAIKNEKVPPKKIGKKWYKQEQMDLKDLTASDNERSDKRMDVTSLKSINLDQVESAS